MDSRKDGIEAIFMKWSKIFMDREFMRNYYRNYYTVPCEEAIAESKEYKEKQTERYRIEDELEILMGGRNTILYKKFDDYISAYADEMEVMLEEMFLMGAWHRERMLR